MMNYTTTAWVTTTSDDFNITFNDTDNNETDGNADVPYPGRNTLYTVLLVVICIWGIIGNIAFMHVMRKVSYMHTVTNIYLLNLSVADLLFLTLGAAMRIVPIYTQYISLVCLIQSFLIYVSSFASMFTIALISIERYVAICHPLKRRHFDLQRSRCARHIVVIWALALLFTVPSILYCYIPQLEMYLTSLIVKTVPFFISLLIIVVTYTLMISKLTCRQTVAHKMLEVIVASKRRKRRLHVVRMLLVTAVVYFLCLLPYHLLQYVLIASALGAQVSAGVIEAFLRMSEILLYINASANPLIYNIMSRQYRKAFRKAFGCRTAAQEDESYFSANMETRRRSTTAASQRDRTAANNASVDIEDGSGRMNNTDDTNSSGSFEDVNQLSNHQAYDNPAFTNDEQCSQHSRDDVNNNNESDQGSQLHVSFSAYDIVHMLDDEPNAYILCSLPVNTETCETVL